MDKARRAEFFVSVEMAHDVFIKGRKRFQDGKRFVFSVTRGRFAKKLFEGAGEGFLGFEAHHVGDVDNAHIRFGERDGGFHQAALIYVITNIDPDAVREQALKMKARITRGCGDGFDRDVLVEIFFDEANGVCDFFHG